MTVPTLDVLACIQLVEEVVVLVGADQSVAMDLNLDST
jgi:hypothetical protein